MTQPGWIFDVTGSPRQLTLWTRQGRDVQQYVRRPPGTFLFSLPDPLAHHGMTAALEEYHHAVPCTIKTIYGEENGWSVRGGREMAEQIETQTRHTARLYNVDLRPEQRVLAAEDLRLCTGPGEPVFSLQSTSPLLAADLKIERTRGGAFAGFTLTTASGTETYDGPAATVLRRLMASIDDHNPDLIRFPGADDLMHTICRDAKQAGLTNTLSRTGRFRELGSRSYFTYGHMEYRPGAMVPEGRIIIDTTSSFLYKEGGEEGIFFASRLTGISPNLTSRFTPGTIISNYEVFEALRRGIAVPFRKADAEMCRPSDEIRIDYRGGLILQPEPAVVEEVHQLDFTSFYPSIIVNYNLSPETISGAEREGFLPSVIGPLLEFRIETKRLKKTDPRYVGIDALLKWMLVTCFGYTGYKNARFGRVELHEAITTIATEILHDVIAIAQEQNLPVLHGIVDCVFVQGGDIERFKADVEARYQILSEYESYDWICFLPQKNGTGSCNTYLGRLTDGTIKIRGLAARRKDTPPYVKQMQEEILDLLAEAGTKAEIAKRQNDALAIYRRYDEHLPRADPALFVIRKKMGRNEYRNNCISASVLAACREDGVSVSAGMDCRYLITDAKAKKVVPEWQAAGQFDVGHYRTLLRRAWEEVWWVFVLAEKEKSVKVGCAPAYPRE